MGKPIKFCSRCEKVKTLGSFTVRKNTCNSCIANKTCKKYPYKEFDQLPEEIKDDLSYYFTVGAQKSFISRKLDIPYSLLSRWEKSIPKFEGEILVEQCPTLKSHPDWTSWFCGLSKEQQKDVASYLTPKRREKILSNELTKDFNKKCKEWGIARGKLKIQLYQTKSVIPTKTQYEDFVG